MTTYPRGQRNNNPGNIRISKEKWQGKVVPSKDPAFETFTTPVMGIRALAKLLMGYGDKGFNTVTKIITRWAPAVENNTKAYIKAVCTSTGFSPTEKLGLDNYTTMLPLCKAIIEHENGKGTADEYTDDQYSEGLFLAGIAGTPKKKLVNMAPAQAVAATAVPVTATVIGEVVKSVEPTLPLLQTLAEYAPWAIAAIAVLGLLYVLYARLHRQANEETH